MAVVWYIGPSGHRGYCKCNWFAIVAVVHHTTHKSQEIMMTVTLQK